MLSAPKFRSWMAPSPSVSPLWTLNPRLPSSARVALTTPSRRWSSTAWIAAASSGSIATVYVVPPWVFRISSRTLRVSVASRSLVATTAILVVEPRSRARTAIGSRATTIARTARVTVETWNRRDRTSSPYSRRAMCVVFGKAGSRRRGAPVMPLTPHPPRWCRGPRPGRSAAARQAGGARADRPRPPAARHGR